MVTNLIFKSGNYYCSNCMVRQSGIPPRCSFCGYLFSNWEELIYKEIMRQMSDEVIDQFANIKDIKVGDKP